MKKYSIVTYISIFISFFTIIGIFSIVLLGYLISNSAPLLIMLINIVVTLLCVVAVIAYFSYIVPAVKKIRNQYRNYESGKIITLDVEETPVLFVGSYKRRCDCRKTVLFGRYSSGTGNIFPVYDF